MKFAIGVVCVLVGTVVGCSQHPTPSPGGPEPGERVMAWPKDWSGHVGQTVTLEGTAANAQLGALLQGKEGAIWIDGLESWPEGFYSGGDKGKRLRVTGTVVRKDDLPVFVQKPGELPRAGIPVTSD